MTPREEQFKETVWAYYQMHGRHELLWRQPESDGLFDPYKILVSEVMLQQTQVSRVIPKFESFMQQFPSWKVLAESPLAAVLQAWSGLGYNRRAKFLWQAAHVVMEQHNGALPGTSAELVTLPGIGPNTAGAILAYAHNKPVVFIETNIRTVFIHHFFGDQQGIADRDILELVARTLPDDARQWYWALMDYGSHLKQTIGNVNIQSKHYTKQSTFEGSRRKIRGQVLRLLTNARLTKQQLHQEIIDERLETVLADLLSEGLIAQTTGQYHLHGA
jgi:A/G-specific adenine glycosylase